MMPSRFLRCVDIWIEILRYFEIFLDDDNENVIKEKKKSIFAITLLSRELKDVGLDALWRDMTTLVPIVSVANSLDELLEYRVSDKGGCWRLCYTSRTGCIDHDDLIMSYLKRIRKLHVQVRAKELELWQLLSHILLRPPQILASLQDLCLQGTAETSTLPFLWLISNLFGPSLTSVTVRGTWGDSWETVQHFMNCLDLPKLTKLSFLQARLNNFPHCAESFTGLQEFALIEEGLFFSLDIFSDIKTMLPALRKLKICVQARGDPTDDEEVEFSKLESLELYIYVPPDFDRFIQVIKIPGLTELKIVIRKGGSDEHIRLSPMVTAFPSLQCLYISRGQCDSPVEQYVWTLEDLAPIMEVRSMKSLKLINIPHELSDDDILTLLKSWSELHTLTITGNNTVLASTILSSLFRFPALRNISLPLDFSSLASHMYPSHTPQSASQLIKIECPCSSNIPDKSYQKLYLVKTLQNLFPKLESISGTGKSIGELRLLFSTANRLYKSYDS